MMWYPPRFESLIPEEIIKKGCIFAGGRGSSSGFSMDKNGNLKHKYGTQYHTVYRDGDVEFVQKNKRQSEPLMETMANGRIYAEVGGKDIIRIIRFDADNKRNRVIEKDKRTGEWHVHSGYLHTEYSEKHREILNHQDRELLDGILRMWSNRK